MDTQLLIVVLAIACAFVFGLVLSAAVVFFRQRGEDKKQQTDSQATIAKWLTERERQGGEVARLRAEVAQVKQMNQSAGKDTPRIWERIREIEAQLKELSKPAPKSSRRSRRDDDDEDEEEDDDDHYARTRINRRMARR